MTAKKIVEIMVVPGCASRQQTKELVARVINKSGIKAAVKETVVKDAAQALQAKFSGSPTVRVNGIDVEPAARERREYGMG